MEEYNYGEDAPKEKLTGDEDSESGFMKGYVDDEEVEECAECGSAIHDKKVVKTIDGELYVFCSEICAKEFEETLGDD
jgi:hypothetical protein